MAVLLPFRYYLTGVVTYLPLCHFYLEFAFIALVVFVFFHFRFVLIFG